MEKMCSSLEESREERGNFVFEEALDLISNYEDGSGVKTPESQMSSNNVAMGKNLIKFLYLFVSN